MEVALESFRAFQEALAEMRDRQNALQGEIDDLEGELKGKLASFDEAVLEGEDPEALLELADALQRKIALKRRELAALEVATSGGAGTGKLHRAARAAWDEGANLITGPFRAEWEAKLKALEDAKAVYLGIVAELGDIERRADAVTSKLSFGLEGFISGAGVPRLATSVYPEKLIGPIFPDLNTIKNAFKKGV
jgi:chromosome segregation ATPase